MDQNRLYRDVRHKTLGGVCAGFANRMGIDPLWVRLLFLVLFFFQGIGLLFYLICWILMPAGEADDAEVVTSSNSGCAKGCLFALVLFLLLTMVPMMVILTKVLLASVMGIGVSLFALPLATFISSGGFMPAAFAALVLFLCSLVIPLLVLVIWLIRNRNGRTLSGKSWAFALILWLLCLIGSAFCGAYAIWNIPSVSEEGGLDEKIEQYIDSLGDTLDSLMDRPSEGVLEITEEDVTNI